MSFGKSSKLFLLLLISVLMASSAFSWWDTDWEYRTQANISENSGQDLENFTVKVQMDTSDLVSNGRMQSSCDDLRFTGSDDRKLLDHWIESGCDTSQTVVWVQLPELNASEEKQINAYYGNPEASDGSDGESTFGVFDDFDDGTVSDQWTDLNSGDSVTESGSRLDITEGNIYSSSKDVKQPGTIVEANLRYTSSLDGDDSGLMIADSGSMSGSNSNSNANVLFISDDSSNTVSMWSGDGSSSSYNICSGISVFTANTDQDYIYGIADTGSEVKTILDYNERSSCSGDLTSIYSDFVIGLGDFNLNSDSSTTPISYDWVRTREYVENEPSVTIGQEEKKGICDLRGLRGECIVNSSKNIENQQINIDSVFESRDTSSFLTSNTIFNISNSSIISGTWIGGLELKAERIVITQGASFTPEDHRILINSTG